MSAMRITPKSRDHDALVPNAFVAADVRAMFSVPEDYLVIVNGAYVADDYPLRDGDKIDWVPDPASSAHKPMSYEEAFDRALGVRDNLAIPPYWISDELPYRDIAAIEYIYRVFGPKEETDVNS